MLSVEAMNEKRNKLLFHSEVLLLLLLLLLLLWLRGCPDCSCGAEACPSPQLRAEGAPKMLQRNSTKGDITLRQNGANIKNKLPDEAPERRHCTLVLLCLRGCGLLATFFGVVFVPSNWAQRNARSA